MSSSFFDTSPTTQQFQLASLHLSRDVSLPVVLSTAVLNAQDDGYAEGVVTNTKFGSFPHSTLIDVPWGSQVRASEVDTGSRGRREQYGSRKRKAAAISTIPAPKDANSPAAKEAVVASSGFIHVLPPTPENWTTSLPHRTQVVYTPDYSYILHRIQARPGSILIEAGSGSGSFTHAAARAVFSGQPLEPTDTNRQNSHTAECRGKVFSYEFHPERHQKVRVEMEQHGLTSLVQASHRDVYKNGFMLQDSNGDAVSPLATAVFLDLPAPWEALPHLTRNGDAQGLSALDPSQSAYICTFSPCIEQVQRTVSALRRLGWLEIEMVELRHKRVEVRREFTGLGYEGMRSVNVMAADVDEAVSRLREVEQRARDFYGAPDSSKKERDNQTTQKHQQDAAKVLYSEGLVIHRSEPELKTHTSYLVFAILPRDWTDEDEEQARGSLSESIAAVPNAPKSQRQLKKEAKNRKKQNLAASKATNGHVGIVTTEQ